MSDEMIFIQQSKTKETIVIPAPNKFWYDRTEDELRALYLKDLETGNTLDSAGEPKLYYKTAFEWLLDPVVITVLRKRDVSWDNWLKKPKHLIEGIATINNVPRIIKVRDPRKVQK